VRAFSDSPSAFLSGFNRLEKSMKALRLRRLLLLPRFHAAVKAALEAAPPEVRAGVRGCVMAACVCVCVCVRGMQRA
jgi:hypothetical protein